MTFNCLLLNINSANATLLFDRFSVMYEFVCFLVLSSFLSNVNSRSRSLFAVARPSVCLSSVTFVRPTQAVQIFGNISMALGTLATLTFTEHFMEIVPGEPLRQGS